MKLKIKINTNIEFNLKMFEFVMKTYWYKWYKIIRKNMQVGRKHDSSSVGNVGWQSAFACTVCSIVVKVSVRCIFYCEVTDLLHVCSQLRWCDHGVRGEEGVHPYAPLHALSASPLPQSAHPTYVQYIAATYAIKYMYCDIMWFFPKKIICKINVICKKKNYL